MTALVTQETVLIAVGNVVVSSQLFEVAFVLAANLALKQADAATLEDVVPVSKARTFKQPVKALLKELSETGRVDAGLETRVVELLEKRHRIIHREYLESRWPTETDLAWRSTFCKLCIEVSAECRDLTVVFTSLLAKWLERFPEVAVESRKRLETLDGLVRNFRYTPSGA